MDLEQRVAALERGLAELQDREAVHHVLAEYAWALDDDHPQELAECFTEDATLETYPWGRRPMEGKAKVLEVLASYRAAFTDPRRFIANEQIEVQGDAATARASWWVVQSRRGESWTGWGTYHWKLRREQAGWKIAHMGIHAMALTTLSRGWGMEEEKVLPMPREP